MTPYFNLALLQTLFGGLLMNRRPAFYHPMPLVTLRVTECGTYIHIIVLSPHNASREEALK